VRAVAQVPNLRHGAWAIERLTASKVAQVGNLRHFAFT